MLFLCFSENANLVNFVKFRQKSIFSSGPPVFVISSVFRQKRNSWSLTVSYGNALDRLRVRLNIILWLLCHAAAQTYTDTATEKLS